MKKLFSLLCASALLAATLAGCAAPGQPQSTPAQNTPAENLSVTSPQETKTPKYVFLFIGDGMTYPQIQSASYYKGSLTNTGDILKGGVALNFMDFPVAGSATTFDSTSFCPDSASTATSIATGKKTHSGVINMDESKTKSYTTISEQLKQQLGFKIGVISSVNLNHATPAAFYAHQPSRGNYYEIGEELIKSEFEYFAGGALLKPTGNDKDKTDLYQLAKDAGYTVAKTKAEAQAVTAENGKVLIIGEDLADSDSISYELDRSPDALSLADYVEKGIEVLNNDKGFFMMVEGGKIDWACHANDAASSINDVLALSDAVDKAIEFANKYPKDTLILVTGDHETGGLSIGYAGTDYDTYLDNIQYQTISYAKYDTDYAAKYVENKTSFDDAMKDVENLFGLVLPQNAAKAKNETLILTDYEVSQLKTAYDLTLSGGFTTENPATQEQKVQYGSYNPFTVTITHLLNNKSGISFTSYSHTGLPAAVYASGTGSELFIGSYDNTEIYSKISSLLGVK